MPSIVDPSVQAADAWLRRFQAALVAVMAAVAGGVGAVAFYTSFEAIKSYARGSNGITPAHAWAIPLLVDSFIVVATGADLWLGVQTTRRAWWEVAWPKALLGGAAMVSFVLNVGHAQAGDWPARGVAAIPPAALVLSVELLVLIVRRAALARTHRLITTTNQPALGEAAVVVRGDQPTTSVAASAGRAALAATSTHRQATRPSDHPKATTSRGDQPASGPAVNAASGGQATGGATYRRVRDLYLGGVTVAAEIARELGISASYAQRTLRRVKADLYRRHDIPTTTPGRAATPERADQGASDPQRDQEEIAARSHDQLTSADPERGDQASGRAEATRDGDGRTSPSNEQRHLTLVARDRDRGQVER